jgi:hypothetical protein
VMVSKAPPGRRERLLPRPDGLFTWPRLIVKVWI